MKIHTIKISLVLFLFTCLLTPTVTIYAGQTPSGILFSELEEQLDAYVTQYLYQTSPGAAVVVVKDGEIILSKGYGYADMDNRIPIDPAVTVFEFGSISKVFVWTAVMQLLEQGLLDLDEDIAVYLPDDFIRKLTYSKPFTMRDLMNHSAGFGGNLFDMMLDVNKIKSPDTLQNALLQAEPKQIHEPGTLTAYSNFGTALAAFIVEKITGQNFAVYERENIFIPAGMVTVRNQPDWYDDFSFLQYKAKSYMPDGMGGFNESIWSYVPMYPAGGVNGTVIDLARFITVLTPPQGESSVLFENQETLLKMFSPSSLDPAKYPGTHHGFMQYDGVYPSFGHGGNTVAFSTYFNLVPEERFGFAVLTNAQAEQDIVFGLTKMLLGKMEPLAPETPFSFNAEAFEGTFVTAQRQAGSPLELLDFLALANITALDESTLKMVMPFGMGEPLTGIYIQTEPYVFHLISADNPATDAFYNVLRFEIEDGKPSRVRVGNGFDMTALPTGRGTFVLMGSAAIAIGGILYFLLMPVVLLIGFGLKKVFYRESNGLLLCGTLFIVNFLAFVTRIGSAWWRSSTEFMPHIWVNYALLVVAVVSFGGSLLFLRKGEAAIKRKVLFISTIIILLLLVIVLFKWNFFVLL